MTNYPPAVKAQVITAWELGTPKAKIARDLGVSRGYVQQVTRGLPAQALLSSEKKDDLGELIYDYLVAGLRALAVQAREVSDPEYIKKQPADALYLLHGTIADKLILVLRGIERAQPANPDGSPLDVHGAAVVG